MPRLKNKIHECFCQHVASGCSQRAAYLEAVPDYTGKNARFLGCQMRQAIGVNERIAELLEKNGKRYSLTKDDLIARLQAMLDTAPEEAELDDPNCDLKHIGKDGDPVAIPPDRLRVMEMIARLQGYNKDSVEVTASQQVLDILGDFKG